LANKLKGEVSFEANDQSYTMRFSTNALCELEDALDMGINAVAEQLSKPDTLRLKTVRAVFWAGLRDHHPGMTVDDAGNLVSDITMPKALELIGKAFELTFQDAPKVRPPKPGQVAGPASKAPSAGTGLLS
jgi:hypothetical protein